MFARLGSLRCLFELRRVDVDDRLVYRLHPLVHVGWILGMVDSDTWVTFERETLGERLVEAVLLLLDSLVPL